MTYQEFAVRAGGAAPLLGPQPRRLGPDGPRRAQRRAPGAGRAGARRACCGGLITQNVDGLHAAAGSRTVIDLHGRIADVVCVGCHRRIPARRAAAPAEPSSTPASSRRPGRRSRPPRTATRSWRPTDGFRLAACTGCGGRAQAGRRVLRGERAARAGGPGLRAGRRGGGRRRSAAGRRLLADGHVRAAVRPARAPARDAGGDRQPRSDPGGRAGHAARRRRLLGVPHARWPRPRPELRSAWTGAQPSPVRAGRPAGPRAQRRTAGRARPPPPQHSGSSTSTASTTCSGNGSWVTHSSTASHQSASARARPTQYPAPFRVRFGCMFAVYAAEPNPEAPAGRRSTVGERPDPEVPDGWVAVYGRGRQPEHARHLDAARGRASSPTSSR